MKTIIISVILSAIACPLQASQPGNRFANPSACQKTYEQYLQGLAIGRDEMMSFLDNCMPVDPAVNEEPHNRKLLQIVDDDKRIITVKT